MASVLHEYDRDAYEPIYGTDKGGKPSLIGVKRRDQDKIDRRRAEKAAKAQTVAA